MNPQAERYHPSRGGTPSPNIAYNGHHSCTCGTPEPVRVCACNRKYGEPLELGSCNRCRFWLRHLNGDHRAWWIIPEEQALYEQAMGKKLEWR